MNDPNSKKLETAIITRPEQGLFKENRTVAAWPDVSLFKMFEVFLVLTIFDPRI